MRDLVSRDPEILGGTPVFTGTRVPVAVLFENLAAGLSLDEILVEYPTVSREQAVAALQLAEFQLTDEPVIRLDEPQYAHFLEALDAPLPAEKQRNLEQLLAQRAPWETPTPLRIYIDMDGVLCDIAAGYKRVWRESPETKYPQSVPGIFERLDPMPGAIEAVNRLRKMEGVDLWIASRPSVKNPHCYSEKRIWIERHFDYI